MTHRRPRALSLTADHLARIARHVPEQVKSLQFTQMTDADFEDLAERLLRQIDGEPFWIFAYGSLIWKPDFEHVETRRSIAHGWRRSFCLHITEWRATPEQPGLMLALQRGGACTGIAYRMPQDRLGARMMRLLRREITYYEDVAWLRWLTLRGDGMVFKALTFYCAPENDPDVLRLSRDEQADRLARAVGPAGSCAEYLHNTVAQLDALDIRDSYLWALQARVAGVIDRL